MARGRYPMAIKGGRYPRVRKTMLDGVVFDSKRESERYIDLQLMVACDVISNLTLQPKYRIVIGGVKVMYPSGRQLTYIADFQYWDREKQKWIIEDCKGHQTDVFKIKRALMLAMGHEILLT